MSFLDVVAKTCFRIATDTLVPLASPERWTTLRTPQGALVCGVAFGKRFAKPLGVTGLLVLQPDDGFLPMLVPVEEHIVPVEEHIARESFVQANKAGYIPRGHAFESSPVFSQLCSVCACDEPAHERDRVEMLVKQVLGTLDINVLFAGDTTKIADIKVRNAPIQKPRMNPVPDTTSATGVAEETTKIEAPKATYRSLTSEERALVDRAIAAEAL